MSFSLSAFLNTADQYIKIKAWLQFVGMALAVVSLALFTPVQGFVAHVGRAVAIIAIFVAFAGFDYKRIYR